MALQRAKASLISTKLGWSASRSAPRVSSENTTPQPKVASGGLRSITRTWWRGSAFFISSAKYRPAGPAPRMPILTATVRRSRQNLGQALELRQLRHGRQQHQVVASRLLVATHQILDQLRRGQVAGRDALGERAREGIVVPQVGGAPVGLRPVAEREVGLAPKARPAGAPGIGPGRPRLGRGAGEGPGRAPAVDVAVGVPGHTGEGPPARAAHQQLGPARLARRRADAAVLPRLAQIGELLVEAPAAVPVVGAGDVVVLVPGA